MKNAMQDNKTKNMILAAMFMAIAVILPLFTAQLKSLGNALLPMHFPVMLCGFVCGWKYGLAVGFIAPLFRGAVFGMPILFPNAVWMAFELGTYGAVCGFMYSHIKSDSLLKPYVSLVSAMIAGRVVWGIVKALILGFGGQLFTIKMFIAGGVLNAVPGIILQIVLIPPIVIMVNKRRKHWVSAKDGDGI